MLDSDLAEMYNVETRVLNQSVKRNSDRSPEDFMFSTFYKKVRNLEAAKCDLKLGRGKTPRMLLQNMAPLC